MIKFIKKELEIEESLKQRIMIICDFCNTTPTIINGSIRKIDKTNLTYIEPHRIIIKDNLYLAFNYSNEIYVHNLDKKIKLSELENYIKQAVLRSEKKFSLFLRLKNEEEKTFSQNIK